jgi:hypothetical protein
MSHSQDVRLRTPQRKPKLAIVTVFFVTRELHVSRFSWFVVSHQDIHGATGKVLKVLAVAEVPNTRMKYVMQFRSIMMTDGVCCILLVLYWTPNEPRWRSEGRLQSIRVSHTNKKTFV